MHRVIQIPETGLTGFGFHQSVKGKTFQRICLTLSRVISVCILPPISDEPELLNGNAHFFEEDYLPENSLPLVSQEGTELTWYEFFATQMFRFDIICQSEIQIIPSKNKMVPNCHTMELNRTCSLSRPNLNQCKIGCTTTNITDQNLLSGAYLVLPVL